MNRIRCLLIKELAQLRRDPRLFRILLVAPLVQLLVMGFAATMDIREIALAIRDNDHTYHSREYARALGASGYFKTTQLSGSEKADETLLVTGRAGLIVVIPPGFGRQLDRQQPVNVQVLVDGADSNFGVQGVNYLQKATRLFNARQVQAMVRTLNNPNSLPSVVAESRVWYNPELTSRYFMVPGIMALLLLLTTMMVTSMALVKEREEGTLEQIIVTPLRPHELIIGKLLPYVVVGFVEVTFALVIIFAVFRVPFHGSFLLLYALSGLFLLSTLGLGLFISTLVKTQQQAMMVSTFFVMMPFVLLSGFAFPVENMPPIIQAVAALIPLKYFLIIIRGIFLKGVGLAELWPSVLILAAWGCGIVTLASLKFHKRLD